MQFHVSKLITKMFSTKIVLLFIHSVLVLSECYVVEVPTKCAAGDGECQRKLYNKLIHETAEKGLPLIGIPPVDPVKIKDVTASIQDVFEFTLVDGLGKGVKNCVFTNLTANVVKEFAMLEKICDVYVEGKYKISSSHPMIKEKLGKDSIAGEGPGTLKMDGLKMHIEFHYHIERHADGEIYIKNRQKEITDNYEYTKKPIFSADKIFDTQEDNDFAVNFINENIEPITLAVGEAFVKEIMEFYYIFNEKFYDNVPVKYFVLGDLSPYVKNKN